MDGQIFTLELAAPQMHGHQADPGKDKKKTRRTEAGGLEVCTGGVSAGSEPAPQSIVRPEQWNPKFYGLSFKIPLDLARIFSR